MFQENTIRMFTRCLSPLVLAALSFILGAFDIRRSLKGRLKLAGGTPHTRHKL